MSHQPPKTSPRKTITTKPFTRTGKQNQKKMKELLASLVFPDACRGSGQMVGAAQEEEERESVRACRNLILEYWTWNTYEKKQKT